MRKEQLMAFEQALRAGTPFAIAEDEWLASNMLLKADAFGSWTQGVN